MDCSARSRSGGRGDKGTHTRRTASRYALVGPWRGSHGTRVRATGSPAHEHSRNGCWHAMGCRPRRHGRFHSVTAVPCRALEPLSGSAFLRPAKRELPGSQRGDRGDDVGGHGNAVRLLPARARGTELRPTPSASNRVHTIKRGHIRLTL